MAVVAVVVVKVVAGRGVVKVAARAVVLAAIVGSASRMKAVLNQPS